MFSSRHKIVTPRIVQPDSSNRKWWFLFFLVLVVIWSWFVYDFGRQRAGFHSSSFASEIAELEEQLELKEKRIEQLRLESATNQRSAQIDKNAAMMAQQDLRDLQQEKAELKREVDFLNRLLSDSAKKAVIRLDKLAIARASTDNSYRLRFTLVHLSKVGGSAKGNVFITVTGSKQGKQQQLALESLTTDKTKSLKMGFKNFQQFDVTLTLPEGFEPLNVTVSADVEGKTLEDFKQTQPWRIAEN